LRDLEFALNTRPGRDRRHRIEAVFDAVLDADTGDRPAVLERECANDPDLRREVEALLSAHDRAAGILEQDAFSAVGGVIASPADERIGPYRLLRRIGRGGMGIVYLAERDDGQFRRRVAIKVLPSGAEDLQLYRRFLAERQILASLDHPNIARLLDGGMTDAGLPYLVLEYVEGLPITEYCNRHRQDIGERLRLFRTVCEAVHFAHQNLVIHRDIKPGNIFVGEDGVVKLLDFGIAKLLNPGLFPTPLPVTRTEHRAMTPEYASPEQLRGDPITTASDVYSLGVVLYELLAGRHPYRLTRHSQEEIIRAVCERDPERPSTRIARSDPEDSREGVEETTAAAIGEARSSTPERLRRRLRGDLDAIIMMALRKEPNRRYASAELLSADVARYLDELPVLAHRGSGMYRFGKLVRRHRLGAAAAILVAVSLAGGAGMALWQASLAGRERDVAEQARLQTQTALDESQAVADFLMGLFEASSPGETLGDTVTARELLERGVQRADQLVDSPPVQARMLDVIGRVFDRMGEYAQATATLQRALVVRRASSANGSIDIAESLAHLGETELHRGDYVSAIAHTSEALDIRRQRLGPADSLTTRTMVDLGGLLIYRGRLDESEALYREALSLQESRLGPDHPDVAATLIVLGSALHRRGREEEAETVLRRALDIRERVFGPEHVETAGAMYQLADLISLNPGSVPEAVDLYRRGVAMERRLLGENTPVYVSALTRYADFLATTGLHEEADTVFREAIATRRRVLGPRHPTLAEEYTGYARNLYLRGHITEADSIFRRAIPQLREGFGRDHTKVAQAEIDWASVRANLGDHDQAEALADDALRIRRLASGGETTIVGLTLAGIAGLRTKRGDYAGADSLYRKALEIILRSYPPDHFDVRRVHSEAAAMYDLWGKPDLAAEHRRAAGGLSEGENPRPTSR
jgi:eukaryotic-like serine/threonine-protein kinase